MDVWALFSVAPTLMNTIAAAECDERGGRVLMYVYLVSRVDARHFRTWLCHQV